MRMVASMRMPPAPHHVCAVCSRRACILYGTCCMCWYENMSVIVLLEHGMHKSIVIIIVVAEKGETS